MNKEFIKALDEIQKEKGIDKQDLIEAVENALKKSFEENYNNSNVEIDINPETGDTKVYAIKEVVEEVIDSDTQLTLEEAKTYNKRAKIGGVVKIKVVPKNFLRVAAHKGKNAVIQFLRNAERQSVYDNYKDKDQELINGMVQRIENNNIHVDLGMTEGVIPERERVEGEEFEIGDRIKVFVKEVKNNPKGTQIILSRKDANFVTRLFELEVPEISQGVVEVMSVSREAGFRTKIAVHAVDESIDPVGASVGLKGNRVNSIVDEINGEKIDIIVWSDDIKVYISNSLSPAEVVDVYVNENKKEAVAFVPDSQISLAIGKEGQNVRLAARLTNWKIDIKAESLKDEVLEEIKQKEAEELLEENVSDEENKDSVIQEQDSEIEVKEESEEIEEVEETE